MTPSYERIRQRFQSFMVGDESADVGHLVLALLCEESLGGKCLSDLGVTIAGIADGCFGSRAADTAMLLIEEEDNVRPAVLPLHGDCGPHQWFEQADWFHRIHERAGFIAKRSDVAAELSTEHLVQAMVEVAGPARSQLHNAGISSAMLLAELNGDDTSADELEVDFELNIDDGNVRSEAPADAAADPGCRPVGSGQVESSRVMTLIDASLNRAREGFRVLEDYARFVCRDPSVTAELKSLRHELVATEIRFRKRVPHLLSSRDTTADVGTGLTTEGELKRQGVSDVVTANARRVQESLRSLEEFGKTLCSEFALGIKQLRYQSYHLEQRLAATQSETATGSEAVRVFRQGRLAKSRLYVLLTESACGRPWKDVVERVLQSGADVIQLREKTLADDELVRRSQWIAGACEEADALFILNDRADLAKAAGAHGVHLGQEDLSIADARRILLPEQLAGISTHNVSQLKQACADGADYLGVGPVFSSQTKSFSDFPGLSFVREAAAHASCPWFAIGGIDAENVDRVIAAGAHGVAVCQSVIGAANPGTAAADLVGQLHDAASDGCDTVRFPRP